MDSTLISKIGETLARLRAHKGVTQDAVATALGVSNKTISKWETGISAPEAEYIPLLADYFEVSTDEIFGRASTNSTFRDHVNRELKDLSSSESVEKTFEMIYHIIRQSTNKIRPDGSNQKVVPKHIVTANKNIHRCAFASNIGYEVFINNHNTNMATVIYQNDADFAWLDDNASDLTNLFKLLSDTSGIKIIKLIYTYGFTDTFTADYIADKAGIDLQKAQDLLELATASKLCVKREAHLRDGFTYLYECNCHNGMVLAILNLAYELICGYESHECYVGSHVRLIRGDKV